jgi:uncharacterized protein (DUF169 family)/NAD-dependent dihydropyrimidine dehydrogenase PreA subunit
MPLQIDQNQCVNCGSCIGNCPNRAIIRRGSEVIITDMCCDCGICVQFCALRVIGKGSAKAQLNHKKLDEALKDRLSLKKDIVAMRFADVPPDGMDLEDGLNFWCHICGDIFDGNGSPQFFTAANSVCGGSTALGLGARSTKRDDVVMLFDIMTGEGGYHTTNDLFTKSLPLYPNFPRVYGGVVMSSFSDMSMPDIIILPVNGKQMSMVATAYAYETGESIPGDAGGGTCLETVAKPFIENIPVFTCGDHGGRVHMRLEDTEILVSLPFKLVPGVVKNLNKTVFAQKN